MKDENSTKVKIDTKIDFAILDNENLQIATSHQGAFNDIVAAHQVEVMRLKDEGIRQALVKLGWTPPGMAPSIHEDNVRTLQGIIDDLRIILGAADGERITDAARRAAAKQPAQAAQAEVTTDANLEIYEAVEQAIVARYVVGKRIGGGFWGHCVKAGDGDQEIFIGHKNACENVRQALQTACLDGAFMAQTQAHALRPSTAPNLSCRSVQARLAAQWGYVRPASVPMTDEPQGVCNNGECAWGGAISECRALGSIHPLCPVCSETVEPCGITAQAKKEGA